MSQPEVPAVPPSASLLSPSEGGINTEIAGESARTGGDTEADSTKKAPVRKSRRGQGLKPLPRISLTKRRKGNSITVKQYQAIANSPDEDIREDVEGKTSEAPVPSEADPSTLVEAPFPSASASATLNRLQVAPQAAESLHFLKELKEESRTRG